MKSRGALQEILNAQIAFKVANEQEFDESQDDFADIDEIKDSKASDSVEKRINVNEQFDRAYRPC